MNKKKQIRTVITTDGEVDDMNSLIRFLLYSNEVDLAGIVLTSSMYHYQGDKNKGIEPYRWTGTKWLFEIIDRYEQVYDNLCVHSPDYPTASYLRENSKIGNVSYVGEMEEKTEGSEFLKELFLDDDPRELYVQTWGGTNTTAKALKDIEEMYKNTSQWKDIQQKIYDKLIIYIILDQDDSYSNYIAIHWPKLKIINDRFNFWQFAYAWKMHDPKLNRLITAEWFKDNIKYNHGPLLEYYALIGDGNVLEGELLEEQRGIDLYLEKNPQYERYDFISEGDSPSFFYLFDFGLRSLENPSYGGWGGRFKKVNNQTYVNDALDYNPYTNQYEAEYSLERWFDDIQNDFANRADWCITDKYENANHAPSLEIEEGLDIKVRAGKKITLSAKSNQDVSYKWYRYFEADSYELENNNEIEEISIQTMLFGKHQKGNKDTRVVIENNNERCCIVNVPNDIKTGETIHIICEATNKGKHPMKRYARIILEAL